MKPSGLSDDKWNAIVAKAKRGQSFKEAMEDNGDAGTAAGAGDKLYGGMTIAAAKAAGYTGFNTDTQQWVK